MTTESSDELDSRDMKRLRDGHDAALNDLMERHAQRLFHYLIRQLQDESEAEDATQETFLRVFQHRQKFDPSRRFSTWLYTIATNHARDRQRHRARHPRVSLEAESEATGAELKDMLPAGGAGPEASLVVRERADAVRSAIAGLPEDLRTVILLFEYEEQSYQQIGEVLNCSPKAVEMRLYRGRQELRKLLVGLL